MPQPGPRPCGERRASRGTVKLLTELDRLPLITGIVMSRLSRTLLCALRLFGREERGAVLIYVTLMLPVLIGGALVAVDASRLYNLSTALQKGADALALAGAAELDRKPDAIDRATAAIANMVANQHKFSNAGTANVALAGPPSYLIALPASDATAIGSGFVYRRIRVANLLLVPVPAQENCGTDISEPFKPLTIMTWDRCLRSPDPDEPATSKPICGVCLLMPD